MKKSLQRAFKETFPSITFNEKLSKYSTFQIGGPADLFYKLKQTKNLMPLLKFCKKHRLHYFILGGGSNILFADEGFRGLVIKIETKNIKYAIKSHSESKGEPNMSGANTSFQNTNPKSTFVLLTANAGLPIATLVQESIKHNLSGLENWTGLPGTVGGAVRGNAGCNGLETSRILTKATILNPKTGKIRTVQNKYFNFKYRHSKLKKTLEIVLSATFRLSPRQISIDEQKKIISALHKSRITKQPFGSSTGSFFKNPSPRKPAGLLIEQAGLKGKIIGKAQISPKHANFILNLGGATAQNILELADFVRKTVKAKFGLTLKEEVQILSAKGPKKL